MLFPQLIRLRQGLQLLVLLAASVVVPVGTALALIFGGEGNEPLAKQGWPAGAGAIFDIPQRVAWWEGPPLGGGQYHAECRGDMMAFNKVLENFAKLDVKTKRLVIHDGEGRSFWLGPNRRQSKEVDARIDWMFMVWSPASWERLRKLPAEFNPTDPRDVESGPPSQIDLYTGGNIRWADVVVPEGIEVIDQRLEAHGHALVDGVVVEGIVTDLLTQLPIAAKVELQEVARKEKGGYEYPIVAKTTSDAKGHWVFKRVSAGNYRVVVESPGYVPRIVRHVQPDGQPRWYLCDAGLSAIAVVSGEVTDEMGEPIADVQVTVRDVIAHPDQRYNSPEEYRAKTDSDGRFEVTNAPVGEGRITIHKPGYCRPGLGESVSIPTANVILQMKKSSAIVVTVDFSEGKRPDAYIVNIEPEGGSVVGSWGGSGNIDEKNQITFSDVPPGRYTFVGHPNPTNDAQKTEALTIELIGGRKHELTIEAK